MRLKKAAALLILLSMITALVCSCSQDIPDGGGDIYGDTVTETEAGTSDGPSSGEEKNPTKKEAEELLNGIGSADLGGKTVTVLGVKSNDPVPVDESEPDYVSKAAAVEMLEKKLNCRIVSSVAVSGSVQFSELITTYEAGLYSCDFAVIPQNCLGSYIKREMASDLGQYEGIGLDLGIYNSSSVEQFNIFGKQLALSGYFGENVRNEYALYYEKVGNDNSLYVKAASGELMWEDVFAYYKSAGTEIETISSYIGRDALSDIFYLSSGSRYLTKDEEGRPARTVPDDRTAELASKVSSLYKTAGLLESYDGLESFFEGKSKLLVAGLSAVTQLTDKKEQWGILPIPKYTSDQAEYRAAAPSDAGIIIVPPSHKVSGNDVGLIIRGLCCATYKMVRETVFTEYMRYNLRDNGSVNMLPLICDSMCFDFSLSTGDMFGRLAEGTYLFVRKCFRNGTSVRSYSLSGSKGPEADIAEMEKLLSN